jgi:hypothetical protein
MRGLLLEVVDDDEWGDHVSLLIKRQSSNHSCGLCSKGDFDGQLVKLGIELQ